MLLVSSEQNVNPDDYVQRCVVCCPQSFHRISSVVICTVVFFIVTIYHDSAEGFTLRTIHHLPRREACSGRPVRSGGGTGGSAGSGPSSGSEDAWIWAEELGPAAPMAELPPPPGADAEAGKKAVLDGGKTPRQHRHICLADRI